MIDQFHPSHETLFQRLRTLDASLTRADALSARELREALSSLRAEVQIHFQREEQSGPLNSLAESDPRLRYAAERLMEEHRSLEDGLEMLLGLAATPEIADEGFRRKLRSWISRARKHEMDEDVLLIDAANRDLGTAD
jgi:hypothetical protein